ncbi:MAG: hypothetical protein ABIG84_06140 [archaeon]
MPQKNKTFEDAKPSIDNFFERSCRYTKEICELKKYIVLFLIGQRTESDARYGTDPIISYIAGQDPGLIQRIGDMDKYNSHQLERKVGATLGGITKKLPFITGSKETGYRFIQEEDYDPIIDDIEAYIMKIVCD